MAVAIDGGGVLRSGPLLHLDLCSGPFGLGMSTVRMLYSCRGCRVEGRFPTAAFVCSILVHSRSLRSEYCLGWITHPEGDSVPCTWLQERRRCGRAQIGRGPLGWGGRACASPMGVPPCWTRVVADCHHGVNPPGEPVLVTTEGECLWN